MIRFGRSVSVSKAIIAFGSHHKGPRGREARRTAHKNIVKWQSCSEERLINSGDFATKFYCFQVALARALMLE